MFEKILIVDDEKSIRSSLKGILEDEEYSTVTADSAGQAIKILEEAKPNEYQAAFVDIWMPGMDGLGLLDWMQSNRRKLPVIIMSGHGTIETAVKATKKGAYDFIEKPLSLEKVLIVLQHALKEQALKKENEELKRKSLSSSSIEIVGRSAEIQAVLEQIKTAAPTDGWVLISGENGTGKELVAKQIHRQSLRKNEPFVELNCAAIPDELIESELFGHEKGSFSGAANKKVGKFDQANGGTLFLDEIGDMSLKTQSKILRILQEQRFERLGTSEMIEVDVRIIAASNKDLQQEIKKGNFREDLFYRLNVIPIDVPPLRERKEDIPILIDYYLNLFSRHGNQNKKSISKEAKQSLMAYHWPGNIRELKNIVERIVIMVKEPEIKIEHVPPVIRMSNSEFLQVHDFPTTLKEASNIFEKQFLKSMLKRNEWNLSETATMIEIEREQLQEKIKDHGITVPNLAQS